MTYAEIAAQGISIDLPKIDLDRTIDELGRDYLTEVLYAGRDPYSHKVFINLGAQQGVKPGSPVADETGVLGQVTRVLATDDTQLWVEVARDEAPGPPAWLSWPSSPA